MAPKRKAAAKAEPAKEGPEIEEPQDEPGPSKAKKEAAPGKKAVTKPEAEEAPAKKGKELSMAKKKEAPAPAKAAAKEKTIPSKAKKGQPAKEAEPESESEKEENPSDEKPARKGKQAAAVEKPAKKGKKDDPGPSKKAKTGLSVGDEIPEFELEYEESEPGAEKKLTLKEITSEKGAIFFFYPKANTGGCTKQACGFKEHIEEIRGAGYEVYGMSADKPKSQMNWKKKYDLPYHLLSDVSKKVMLQLGVYTDGKINRSHIVIEKGGKVKDVRIKISPADSFKEAVKTVTGK